MCGITGLYRAHGRIAADDIAHVQRATDVLHHRGPDDHGLWSDPDGFACLGHRRLSIIDLSPAGHQPMASADGRWIIAFNGEMYNFEETRGALPARQWRGSSDTEVLLEDIAENGPLAALTRATGMMAAAVYDRVEKELWLARDRFGKKPLYHMRIKDVVAFASEFQAMAPWIEGASLDPDALASFLRDQYLPGASSIVQGLGQVAPGTIEHHTASGVQVHRYFDPIAVARQQRGRRAETSVESFQHVFDAAVGRRMVADVPLGAFLSGGIDSSLVVASMQRQSDRPVKTFSIGFEEAAFDEAAHARKVSEHFGTDHHEHYVTPEEALKVVEELPSIFAEPFADPSAIPTYLVCKNARKDVTVALTGDGGDEVFGGYERYIQTLRYWNKLRWLTPVGRRLVSGLLSPLPAKTWDTVFGERKEGHRKALDGPRVRSGLRAMRRGAPGLYEAAFDVWGGQGPPVLQGTPRERRWPARNTLDAMMLQDTVDYMPDDILVKVDRASMAVSLELRAPFLDEEVYRYAWSLPRSAKIADGQGKVLLRQVLRKELPGALADRPKQGFGMPVGEWLRGPLKGWAEGLLESARSSPTQPLDMGQVEQAWRRHCDHGQGWGQALWPVLMFIQTMERTGRLR